MGNASALAGLLLLFGTAAPAAAQQPATVDGAYARLTPGNAKVARALFEAQVTNTTPGVRNPKALSMDQIAAMKAGQDWGQVFSTMKAQGLVTDKNLGAVVSRYQHRTNTNPGGTAVSARGPAAPRSVAVEPSASYEADTSK
jgi:hypothetical protein